MSFFSVFHFSQMLQADALAVSQARAILLVSGSNTGSFNTIIASRIAVEHASNLTKTWSSGSFAIISPAGVGLSSSSIFGP